ncbi:hypothetical protein CRV00_07455 [Malaciobacter molluscorum]|uniref:hypothetical protein n=1 Tax=Malaciobacter molluscorum TaxID=1032072 RepID=UPI00100AD7D4|nr:hypothetical protein [Malaciobacter molluscorum]RXJ94399.1 hypothetical protein CRV00_07455 [Malaciobacter molluscorum]
MILKNLNSRKIELTKIEDIYKYFIQDFTASDTAKKVNLSRQTINKYYKDFRTLLLNKTQNRFDITNTSQDYIILYNYSFNKIDLYYIEHKNRYYYLDKEETNNKKLFNLIEYEIKEKLANHKKANAVKILYNKDKNSYFILGYLNSSKNINDYISKRLKKFRGINKNNYKMYLEESFIRYNTNKEYLLNFIF